MLIATGNFIAKWHGQKLVAKSPELRLHEQGVMAAPTRTHLKTSSFNTIFNLVAEWKVVQWELPVFSI